MDVVHADVPLEGCKHLVTPFQCIAYTCFARTTHLPLVELVTPKGKQVVHFQFGACAQHLTTVRLALSDAPFLRFVCGLLDVPEVGSHIMRVTFEQAPVGSA